MSYLQSKTPPAGPDPDAWAAWGMAALCDYDNNLDNIKSSDYTQGTIANLNRAATPSRQAYGVVLLKWILPARAVKSRARAGFSKDRVAFSKVRFA